MKVQILSDLHREFHRDPQGNIPKIREDVDVIVFAGDIATKPYTAKLFFEKARDLTDAKFIYIMGNHEYYGNVFPYEINSYREALKSIKDLYNLEKQGVEMRDVMFIGTTM